MACDKLWTSLSFTIAKYLHHNVEQIKNPIFLSNSILCTLSCVCTFIDQSVEMDDKACVCKKNPAHKNYRNRNYRWLRICTPLYEAFLQGMVLICVCLSACTILLRSTTHALPHSTTPTLHHPPPPTHSHSPTG